MSYRKLRKDEELKLQKQFNAIEKILPAPLAISLLSQIVLIAADGPDFAVTCPTGGCKHLSHSNSFKASLLQLSFGAYDAFNAAHVNMDIIDRNMGSLPGEIRYSLETLITGSDFEIKHLLPDQLNELKRIAQKSRSSANATAEAFTVVKNVLEELVQSATVTQLDSTVRVQELNLTISLEKKRARELKNQKKEAKEWKDKVKKQLEKAEQDWEEALDNLPTGWTMLGLKVTESLTNAVINVVDIVSLRFIPNIANKIFGSDDNEQKNNQDNPDASIEFPACNLAPAQSRQVTITEALQVGYNFQTAVTNMKLTVEHFEQYIDNIFVRPSQGKLSLSPRAESLTNTVMNLLRPSKDQIENSGQNAVPMAMRGSAVTFYRKIFEFMEEVIKADKNRGTPPIDLERQAKKLTSSGQCFYSWLIRLLHIQPITPKVPFKENQNKPKSISEAHRENANRRVEEYKSQMQNREEAFKKASDDLMIVSHNMTEIIIKLAEFDASKATLEEVLKILKDALVKLNELRMHWLEIREFFQKISTLVDEGVGADVDKYVMRLISGQKIKSLRKEYYFKNKVYANIRGIRTQGHLVQKLSTTYLQVSDQYILPPVRKLGEMLQMSDVEENKRLRAQIATETKTASREMSSILKAQEAEFLDSMRKRREELENIYRPIFEQIPEERKREIKEEVNNASAQVALIEQRTGLQGSPDSFIDD